MITHDVKKAVSHVRKEARFLRKVLREMDVRYDIIDEGIGDISAGEDRKDRMIKAWLRRYVFAYKLRRRACRLFASSYTTERDCRKAAYAMDEALGRLDMFMKSMYRRVLCATEKPHIEVKQWWRNRPNPPWFIETEWFRWAEHEAREDFLLDHDWLWRTNVWREKLPPRPGLEWAIRDDEDDEGEEWKRR